MSLPQDRYRRLAEMAARAVLNGFETFGERFHSITVRAKQRFENRDWHGMMADMGERLELNSGEVNRVIARLRGVLGQAALAEPLWEQARIAYDRLLGQRRNRELAETFFNSISRRILQTVGKNPETEFDSAAVTIDPRQEDPPVYDRYAGDPATAALIARILEDRGFRAPFADLASDARRAGAEVDRYLTGILGSRRIDAVEMIRPVFFRQKMAFVIGRVRTQHHLLPLVLALRHDEGGIAVDAVLMKESELSIIFSFTRSHFHVAIQRPWDLLVFLKSIMPLKPLPELYIALGFHKHGKTELYRSLHAHLDNTIDRFEHAKGARGMVMLVFTLPFYNVVFKVIRDRFPKPKNTTRQAVMDAYRLVFTHDRVGRLVEAQEFEYLEFRADQFHEDLLRELKEQCAGTVSERDGAVVIRHVYVERKVEPLDVFLRSVAEDQATAAVQDYGEAIRELAKANIFPGDFLLKNFGVTRNGRVVFYDYDELCLMTDCNFRRMPPARNPEDELSAEPWFFVGPNDIFPEEFDRFLEFPPAQRRQFLEQHGDLVDARFWSEIQERLLDGEIMDVFPYPKDRRLEVRQPVGRAPAERSTAGD